MCVYIHIVYIHIHMIILGADHEPGAAQQVNAPPAAHEQLGDAHGLYYSILCYMMFLYMIS